jgi:glycosyltransferase involved in cell wall biosynthesis
MTRILAIAAPDSSGHYRIRQPFEELKRQGVEGLAVVSGIPVDFDLHGVKDVCVDTDVVVIQRPMLNYMPSVIDVLHRKKIKVVIDLDDDFHTAHGANTAFHLNHPRLNPTQNWHHLGKCITKADLLTVSTDQLARRYGSHGRCVVIRNSIDDDWLDLPRLGDGRTLGWAGSPVNHADDLTATRGGVAMALDDHRDWHFMCVGGGEHVKAVQKGLGLSELPEATDWRPLELHGLLICALDVGIVPLSDSVFNAAKSWLKGLEYAALGIPFVASDVPEYRRLKEEFGLGSLADSKAKNWRRRLAPMLELDDLRARYCDHSRDIVREHLTISKNAWRWQEAWESLRCRPTRQRQRAIAQ